jgi:hypothetical protein
VTLGDATQSTVANDRQQWSAPFLYAQPSSKLVPGITPPAIENSMAAEFDQWPKSLRELAGQLGTTAINTK